MKTTKEQLKRIIKEELSNIFSATTPTFGDQSKYLVPAYPNPEVNVVKFTYKDEKFFFDGEKVFTAESDEEVTDEFTEEHLTVLKDKFRKAKEEGNFN